MNKTTLSMRSLSEKVSISFSLYFSMKENLLEMSIEVGKNSGNLKTGFKAARPLMK